uniref:Uncharacterized protein n=1 Tax=Oryza punctata TaxID=4537 RepID=A0A0E0KG98_ORYPU
MASVLMIRERRCGSGAEDPNCKYAATLDNHVGRLTRLDVIWITMIHLNKLMDLNIDFTRSWISVIPYYNFKDTVYFALLSVNTPLQRKPACLIASCQNDSLQGLDHIVKHSRQVDPRRPTHPMNRSITVRSLPT